MEATLLNFVDQYGLAALFVGLLLSGLGLPVPEDIYMIVGGMITQRKVEAAGGAFTGPVLWALFVLYVGVMIGDTVIYHLGRRYGERILTWPFFARFMSPERTEKVRGYYAKYGAATVFIARHTGPIRFVTFLMAGVSRMPFGKFFFWDSLAAILSVPLWFAIGYFLWDRRHELEQRLGLVITVLALAGLVGLWWWSRKRRAPQPPAA
jgi:membrane protein DedA with SNARE-associated domain